MPAAAGVLIRRVNPTSPAAEVLQPDDVLLSFDDIVISCDGTVPFRTGEVGAAARGRAHGSGAA
jgi:hypothetical protein